MISKTLNLPIVEVYILYYVVEISLFFSLFCCFERHIKLHFSNWQCVGAKMLRSLLENALSDHPLGTPCFILPESAVSVLYTDILYEKDFCS